MQDVRLLVVLFVLNIDPIENYDQLVLRLDNFKILRHNLLIGHRPHAHSDNHICIMMVLLKKLFCLADTTLTLYIFVWLLALGRFLCGLGRCVRSR